MDRPSRGRRSFLISTALAFAGVVLDGCSSLSLSQPAEPVRLSFNDYPDLKSVGGSAQLLLNGMKLIAVRLSENEIAVLNRRCTHRGCSVQYNRERFECPCHGSVYSQDGSVYKGPAVRALEKYKVSFNSTDDFFDLTF